jgi:CNT family concentrative nucleoside transporter
MATISGTVFVVYAQLLDNVIEAAAGHLLVASVISAPAAITVARILVPERQTTEKTSDTEGATKTAAPSDETPKGLMDAIARGTETGIQLFFTVAAMLIVLVALVHLVNAALGLLPSIADAPLSLERVLGWIMAPVTFAIGIPWHEAIAAGALMGEKTVLNEFLAYLHMSQLPAEALSAKSRLIMAYALCGFANFGSLGIMVGGLSRLAPDRRMDIVGLGWKSIVGGTLATLCTGALVGIIS